MKKRICSLETPATLLLLLLSPVYSQSFATGRLRAGAAKVDITPKESDLAIATDSIRDPLFARVIIVDDGSTCAVLVGLDLGGASNQIVDDATPRASRSTGCPVQNFIVSATHTHSSNTLGLGGRGAPTAKTVADAIVEAANAAKSRLAPARVGYATAKIDLNVNRDLFNSKLEWRQEPNPEGPSDKTLAVVGFIGNDNIPIGVYMNYAMHPINFYLSGVNGEVYSQIAMRLKTQSPANKAIVVTLANGMADSGYIYSDEAYSHLTFQVIGSCLKPGCAKGRIVSTALDLIQRSGHYRLSRDALA
jgi:hypothetical protein